MAYQGPAFPRGAVALAGPPAAPPPQHSFVATAPAGITPAPLRQRTERNPYNTSPGIPVRLPSGAPYAAFRPSDPFPGRMITYGDAPIAVRPLVGTPMPHRRAGTRHARPRPGLATLLLLEVAVGLSALAWVSVGMPRLAALVCASLALVLGAVPVDGKWLYQVLSGRLRRWRRGADLATRIAHTGIAGEYQIVPVPTGTDATIAAVRVGTSYTIALELAVDDLLTVDAPVPLADLESMLSIENVPMDSIRLMTVCTPQRAPNGVPVRAGTSRAATRYCLLTFDAQRGADALAARGGSQAAIEQILRRCALRARELLTHSDLTVRSLDDAALLALVRDCLGPAAIGPDVTDRVLELPDGVWVGGTYSTTVACHGQEPQVLGALADAAAYLPGAVSVQTVVLTRRGASDEAALLTLLRCSAPAVPGGSPVTALRDCMQDVATSAGIGLAGLLGEQLPALGLTTPLPVRVS